MLQRTFVRKNLCNSDGIPENIPQGSTGLANELFDRISERLEARHENERLPYPISRDSTGSSPCEIGYVKSGYDVKIYLIRGGVVCLVDEYQALSSDGEDVIQKQMILFHEDSVGLESLCRDLIEVQKESILPPFS